MEMMKLKTNEKKLYSEMNKPYKKWAISTLENELLLTCVFVIRIRDDEPLECGIQMWYAERKKVMLNHIDLACAVRGMYAARLQF